MTRARTQRTSRSVSARSADPSDPRRTVLGGVDPLQLFEMLETKFTDRGGADGSPYRELYRATFTALLAADGSEAVHLFALLDEVDAWSPVEYNIRKAGFVVGFEVCRTLILGPLHVAAAAVKQDGAK